MNQCLPLTTQGAGACKSVPASHHTGQEHVNQCLPLTTRVAGAVVLPQVMVHCEDGCLPLHSEQTYNAFSEDRVWMTLVQIGAVSVVVLVIT